MYIVGWKITIVQTWHVDGVISYFFKTNHPNGRLSLFARLGLFTVCASSKGAAQARLSHCCSQVPGTFSACRLLYILFLSLIYILVHYMNDLEENTYDLIFKCRVPLIHYKFHALTFVGAQGRRWHSFTGPNVTLENPGLAYNVIDIIYHYWLNPWTHE